MHSHFWELCRLLRSAQLTVTLLSTGVTLFRVAENVRAHCNLVQFSLDGTSELHDRIRRIPRAFEKLQRSAHALKTLDPKFPVFGRCVIHRYNFRSMRAIVEVAHTLQFDRLSFLAADITSTAYNRNETLNPKLMEDLALTISDIDELETELELLEQAYADDFASGFIKRRQPELRQRLVLS